MGARLAVLLAMIPAGAFAWQSTREVAIPDNPLSGLRLFESKGCVECHSVGTAASHLGPSLSEEVFDGTFLDLGAALWDHVPGMSVTFEVTGREWPMLTEEETTQLLSFLYFIDYLGQPGDPLEGERLFKGAGGCSSCHVIGGGENSAGPDLGALSVFASPLYVAQEIWNHGPVMLETMRQVGVTPPTFGSQDLADISAFIRQQSDPGLRDRSLLTPGNPNRGREVFTSKGCVACHGTDARGGAGGPDLAAYPLHQPAEAIVGLMWDHAFAMGDAMRARGMDWPEFQGTEMADLVAYLYFLPFSDGVGDPERGSEVFSDRSCGACHSSAEGQAGMGFPDGPDLRGSAVAASPASLVTAMWNHAPVMRRVILQEGRPWPELSGANLRDLRAYFLAGTAGK